VSGWPRPRLVDPGCCLGKDAACKELLLRKILLDIAAIAKGVDDGAPVRFVHVGGASGEESIDPPGAGLRSSSIELMGGGYKSVPLPALFAAVKSTFDATIPAKLQIATKNVPLAEVEQHWNAPGKPRVVFTIG